MINGTLSLMTMAAMRTPTLCTRSPSTCIKAALTLMLTADFGTPSPSGELDPGDES